MITLRRATPDDLELLERWGKEPHVIEAGVDIAEWALSDGLRREVSWREYLIAEREARPIGFIQIIDPFLDEFHYWGEVEDNLRAIDIWLGNALDIGIGYGSAMMRLSIERCFAAPEVAAIIIDLLASNTSSHRFYERLGFEFVERRTFGDHECIVYRLGREKWASRKSL